MRQVFHIFRKDVRHHWPEVVLSFSLLLILAWNEPHRWAPRDFFNDRARGMITTLIYVLLILSWWLLIVRVVQGESLAGDRQFWVTRPYEGKKLLAAKALFLLVFIEFPLLLIQPYLLIRGGFRPSFSVIPQMLWTHLSLGVIVILPIVALATVTPNIAQMLLALLIVGAYTAGTAVLSDYIPNESFTSGSDVVQAAALIGSCLVAIAWQYGWRRTNRSRWMLVAGAAAILLLVVATPYRLLMAHEYPHPRPEQPLLVHLAFDPVKPPAPDVIPDKKDTVDIRIPLIASGFDDGHPVEINGVMLTLKSQEGLTWDSDWTHANSRSLTAPQRLQADFAVKKTFFERTQSAPVTARISVALSLLRTENPRRVFVTVDEFTVPDVGMCALESRYSSDSVHCRFAIQSPRILATLSSAETTCPISAEQKLAIAGKTAEAWSGPSEASPFSAVDTFSLYFGSWNDDGETGKGPRLCPGTPLDVRTVVVERRVGTELEITGLRLADYRLSNNYRFTILPSVSVPSK